MLVPKAPLCVGPCPGQNTLQLPVPAPVQQAFGTPEAVHAALSNGMLLVRLAVPVVSGLSATGMLPMNDAHRPDTHVGPVPAPVQHAMGVPAPVHPPAAVQVAPVEHVRLLKLPLKQRWVPVVAAGVGQSLDTPVAFFD
jgi:hypothetical protein